MPRTNEDWRLDRRVAGGGVMTSRMIRYVRGLLGDESGMSTAEYSVDMFYTPGYCR